MSKILSFLVILVLGVSCAIKTTAIKNESIEGIYSITENYEVKAGGNTGMKGELKYDMEVYSENDLFKIKNFANNYNVVLTKGKDSFTIETQKFLNKADSISISGTVIFKNGNVELDYFAGGSIGQIFTKGTGIKKEK